MSAAFSPQDSCTPSLCRAPMLAVSSTRRHKAKSLTAVHQGSMCAMSTFLSPVPTYAYPYDGEPTVAYAMKPG